MSDVTHLVDDVCSGGPLPRVVRQHLQDEACQRRRSARQPDGLMPVVRRALACSRKDVKF